ncbi:MFS transporter, partial [Tessaracoccus lubricantis]|uniref:MFS transporter n=1 Tax=Tessaracoccus lubricantis TaxID=545543 RepID=UPI003631276E
MTHTIATPLTHPAAALPPEGRAALRGGVLGNYVDQLHIFLPLVALVPALPVLAGPHAAATTGAIVVMAMLLGRPIGGMVFGQIADRLGRTTTTKVAIAGTAACTLGIAAVPTHEVIGGAAILIVIALRFLGGVFIAGEYSAAIPLAMEWSRPRRRGLYSGLIMSMAPWAQATIAFTTGVLLVALGPDAYAAWGWRASFAAGGLASVAMLMYYGVHVTDAPVFHRNRSTRRRLGLVEVLSGTHARSFWQMFGLMSGLWFLTNTTVIMLTPRLGTDVGLDATSVSVVMGCAAVGQAIVMGVTGHLSTLLGRRRFFIIWGVVAAVSAPLLWLAIMSGPAVWLVAACAVALQVLTVTAYGPIGAYLSERFPTAVRATGYGTAYSLSIVIPALYPFYLPTLEGWLGRDTAVLALMVLGVTLLAVCGALGPAL